MTWLTLLVPLALAKPPLAGEPDIALPPPPTEAPRGMNPPVVTAPDEAAAAEPPPVVVTGELRVDAKVPAEILLDGLPLGQLFVGGELRIPVAAGKHQVAVVRGGRPEELGVEVFPRDPVLLVVGRTGTSVGVPELEPRVEVATGPASLEVRVAGSGSMQVRIDGARHELGPGAVMSMQIPVGKHPMSVRSADGTVIWATGDLDIKGPAAVLQLSEGVMPELTGDATFVAHGG